MYDQSFNAISLSKTLRRSDFNKMRSLRDDVVKQHQISEAVQQAKMGGWHTSPLSSTILRKKSVYSLKNFSDELLIRKINDNIRRHRKHRHPARTSIVSNASKLIGEAVCYRLYRLDIKSFYESFQIPKVLALVDSIEMLSIPSRKLIQNLFKHFSAGGGCGIPRGLTISATLSDLMMADFDKSIERNKNVFFYARYVDDILIITNSSENEQDFLKEIKKLLPAGLQLSRSKQFIQSVSKATSLSKLVLQFEYLGYKFSVHDPSQKKQFRKVSLDIADTKIAKIKTRIIRSLISYCDDGNFERLLLRIKFLTTNFSVLDANRSKKRLAGIYYNYHLINGNSPNGLDCLDRFLSSSVLSGDGNIFSRFFFLSTYSQRKILMKLSFKRGFTEKIFLHFPATKLKEIQDCWRYE